MLVSIRSCWANIFDCSDDCIPGDQRIPCCLGVPFLPGKVVGIGLEVVGGEVVGSGGAMVEWVD